MAHADSPATGYRFATAPADLLPELVELDERCFDDPWGARLLAEELAEPRALMLIATPAGATAPVGYACFHRLDDEAELLRLAVLPAHRRRGLGAELLRQGLARMGFPGPAPGIVRCFLEVEDRNRAAIALYRRHGFVQVGHRPGYYGRGRAALLFRLGPEVTSPGGATIR